MLRRRLFPARTQLGLVLAVASATLGLAAPAEADHLIPASYPIESTQSAFLVSAGTGVAATAASGRLTAQVSTFYFFGFPVGTELPLGLVPDSADPSSVNFPETEIDLADFEVVVSTDPQAGDTTLEGVLLSGTLRVDIGNGNPFADVMPNEGTETQVQYDLSPVVLQLFRGHLILTGPSGTVTRDLQLEPLDLITVPGTTYSDATVSLFGLPDTDGVGRRIQLPVHVEAPVAPLGITLALFGVVGSEVQPNSNAAFEVFCLNGIDDDGDGWTDYPDDPGCNVANGDFDRENPRCEDGFDNDFDGLVDYPDDPGCDTATDDWETTACSNGIDDDGDLTLDFPADPGCASALDDDETDPALPCDNGADDDGDTRVDFPDDEGCLSPSWHREDPQCSDGVDNDFDSTIDFDGGAAQNGGTPLAAADPQCAAGAWKDREAARKRCGLGFELAGLALVALLTRRTGRRARRDGRSAGD